MTQTADVPSNKQLCDGYECFAAAEEEIKVQVGQTGKITLAVCKGCKSKISTGK